MDRMVRPCGCSAVQRLERSRGLSFKFARVRLACREPEIFKFSFPFIFLIMWCKCGAGTREFLRAPPAQPTHHRVGGPNKGLWPAPRVRFCC